MAVSYIGPLGTMLSTKASVIAIRINIILANFPVIFGSKFKEFNIFSADLRVIGLHA